MSLILTLNGKGPVLETRYFPSIELDGEYLIALLDLVTFNSIPNVVEGENNLFHIGKYEIRIPTGSYEINDINEYVLDYLLKKRVGILNESDLNKKETVGVQIKANLNTLKTEITTTEKIYFNSKDSIGKILGFENKILEANRKHLSDDIAKITELTTVRVECDIVDGAYQNNLKSNTIYQFPIAVDPGYKIIEKVTKPIYLNVNTRELTTLRIKFLDHNDNLVDFRGENITVRLHLIKVE